MDIEKIKNKFLPLTETTYYILISLVEPMHGYGIMQKVKEISDGEVILAPGTLYGAFTKLKKQGIIESVDIQDNERRKYYKLTEFGKIIITLEFKRLNQLVSQSEVIITNLEGGKNNES